MKIKIMTDSDSKRVDFTVDGHWYHTNKYGEGLWDGDDYTKQIKGTCDFNLRQKSYSGKYSAIKRYFE